METQCCWRPLLSRTRTSTTRNTWHHWSDRWCLWTAPKSCWISCTQSAIERKHIVGIGGRAKNNKSEKIKKNNYTLGVSSTLYNKGSMKREHVPKSKRIHGERVECYGRHWHKSQYLSSSYSTSKKKKAKNKISRVPVNSCQWLHQIQCPSTHTTTTLQEYTSLALKKYVPDIAVVMYAIFETYFTHFSKQYKQHPTILKAHFTNLLPSCHAVGICRNLLRKGWKEGQWLPCERKKKKVKQKKTLPENIPIIPIAFYQTFQSFPMTNYKTVQIQREHTAIHFSVLPLVCWDTYSKAARANWTHAMMNEPNMAAVKKKKRSVSTTPLYHSCSQT